MKTNVTKLLMMAAVAFSLSACHEIAEYNIPVEETVDQAEIDRQIRESFDYNLTTEIPVTLNYGVKGALVEIYDADYTDVAVASRSTNRANKIYSAFTSTGGSYTGKMVIPTDMIGKTVYAFSNSIGAKNKVEAVVTKDGLVVNANSAKTRVVGQGKQALPAGLSDAVRNVLSEGDNHDDKLQNTDINIHVTEDLDYLDVTFVWGGAGVGHWTGFWGSPNDGADVWKCQNGEAEPAWVENRYACNLYYFTYTDRIPTAEEIAANFINDEHLVIGNAAQDTSDELQGTTVRLTVNGSTKIPAGTNIGWVLTHPDYRLAYKWPAVGDRASFEQFKSHFDVQTPFTNYEDFAANWRMPIIYSVKSMNPDGQNQTIRYSYGSGDDEVIVYGIEDLSVTRGNFIWGEEWDEHAQHIDHQQKAQYPFFRMTSDRDYNDIVFIVHASKPEAIHDDNIRDVEKEETETLSSESYEGYLLYEDQFPNTPGAVTEDISKQCDYDMNDLVIRYKLTKTFNQDNELKKISYEFQPIWSGATYRSGFSFMLDGWTDPITVFGNQADYVNTLTSSVEGSGTYIFEDEIVKGNFVGRNKDDVSWSTFNPYITVANTGYEVHLTKKAASPYAKLDGLTSFQLNYVTGDDFPYAINIPGNGFTIVAETVRIDEAYPGFIDWVRSNGASNTDWYRNPAK